MIKVSIWERIKRGAIWISAVCGAVIILFSIGNTIYSYVGKKIIKVERDRSIEIKVDSLLQLFPQMEEVKGNLKDFKTKQEDNEKQTRKLNKSFSDHLQAEKTNNEYIKWLELQIDSTKK